MTKIFENIEQVFFKRSMVREELPYSLNKVLLVIIPGVFATIGLVVTDFSLRMLIGLILLIVYLILAYWWNQKQIPGWSLLAAGMLLSIGITIVSGVIGGLASMIVGKSANLFALVLLLAILTALLLYLKRTQHIPMYIWILIAVIILCQLVVRIKYFILVGVSWSVAGQWLNISLYAAVITLLLPVMTGLLPAKRHGLIAMLFVIGMIYGSFQMLIDVNYKVSDHIGNGILYMLYKALIPFFFTVVTPIWFLLARTSSSRLRGMLTLVGLTVIADLIIVGLSYAGELDLIIWISFIPYTLSVLLTLALAYFLFQGNRKVPTLIENNLTEIIS